MTSDDRKDTTSTAGVTEQQVIQKVDELLNSGEAARRLEASQSDFDKAVAKLRRAEAFDLEKLRRIVTI